MDDVIANAIKDRERLSFNYPPGARTIEPHALGWSSDGHVLLRAFQTEGASSSGEHENWKLFRLDRAGATTANGENFPGPRAGYKRNDKAMKGGIIEQL